MALFEVTEYDKFIYETELKDFLPDNIYDVHAHIWTDGMKTIHHMYWPLMIAKDNSLEDLQETYELLFPGKKVKAMVFAGGDGIPEWNDYISESAKKANYSALYFSRPYQSGKDLIGEVCKGGFVGIKSYLDQAPAYIPSNEIRIYDFFPKHQLEAMNEIGGIVMLHIPRPGRLKDRVNIEEIAEIKREFPNARLVIAHIGRAYTHNDIGDAFDTFDKYPDLMFDFTANCCEYAITATLQHAGPSHLMFGTDMPILRMRTHRIEENGNYVNLIPPHLYANSESDPHLREVSEKEGEKITFFAYEELLALKRSCQKLGLNKDDVKAIMYGNALNMIEDAKKSIYGK